jgi:hypothetical protein
VDHSWLSKPGAETGAFVLALPFSYDPADMAGFRKAADDMLAWATDNFDYPTRGPAPPARAEGGLFRPHCMT